MPYSTSLTAYEALNNYILNLYPIVLEVIGRILGATFIFLLGWLVAYAIKLTLAFLLEKIKIAEWFKRANLDKYFENFTWEERLDQILTDIVFWAVFLVFLMTAFDILGLQVVNSFLSRIVTYIPTAVVGGLILVAGFVLGDLTKKVLIGVLRGLEKKSANAVASFVKWAIIVFAFMTALSQWGVATDIINILLTGLVLFLALAGGLAFGLGGQETAREILENIKKQLR